jgi:hypothetical protein
LVEGQRKRDILIALAPVVVFIPVGLYLASATLVENVRPEIGRDAADPTKGAGPTARTP